MTEVDQIARDNARDALSQIMGHEKVCLERQNHIVASLETLQRGVEKINGRFMAGAITLIVMLLSGCGALIAIILRSSH